MTQTDAQMQRRQGEKDTATAEIAGVLDRLMGERREPDLWERVHLLHALAAVFSGGYSLATAEARGALVPPNQRSPESRLPSDPIFARCDLQLLDRAMRAAMAEPVRRFPHFGPVEIIGA